MITRAGVRRIRMRLEKRALPRLKRAIGVLKDEPMPVRDGARPFNLDQQGDESWRIRAELCVKWIAEISAQRSLSLADVGCGDQKLAVFAKRAGVQLDYLPFDLMPQSEDVVRLDISRETLPVSVDVCALLGVLEYIEKPADVLRSLSDRTRHLVVSHVVSDYTILSDHERRALGWVTQLNEARFSRLLKESGFGIMKSLFVPEMRQTLWMCRSLLHTAA